MAEKGAWGELYSCCMQMLCHSAQGQACLEQVQGTGGSRVGRRMGTDSSQRESACFQKLHY